MWAPWVLPESREQRENRVPRGPLVFLARKADRARRAKKDHQERWDVQARTDQSDHRAYQASPESVVSRASPEPPVSRARVVLRDPLAPRETRGPWGPLEKLGPKDPLARWAPLVHEDPREPKERGVIKEYLVPPDETVFWVRAVCLDPRAPWVNQERMATRVKADHQARRALKAARATRVPRAQQGLRVCEEPQGLLAPRESVVLQDGWVALAGKVRMDPRVYQDQPDPQGYKECQGTPDRRVKKVTLEGEVCPVHWALLGNRDRRAAKERMDYRDPMDLTAFRARRENLANKGFLVHLARMENTERWALLDLREKRGNLDLRVPQGSEAQLVHLGPREMLDHLASRGRRENLVNKESRAPLGRTARMESKETLALLVTRVLLARWVFLERVANLVLKVLLGNKGRRARLARRVIEA